MQCTSVNAFIKYNICRPKSNALIKIMSAWPIYRSVIYFAATIFSLHLILLIVYQIFNFSLIAIFPPFCSACAITITYYNVPNNLLPQLFW